VGCESVVAGAALALGARQRVLLVRLGMQEHGEVTPDLLHSLARQVFGGAAHDDPVTLFRRSAQELVPNGAADQIHFHAQGACQTASKVTTSSDMKRFRLLWLTVPICCQLSGCYLMQTANGQMDLMSKRKPIGTVIADPATAPDLKSRLERVVAMREFAVRELH